jgi:hypothetical protein
VDLSVGGRVAVVVPLGQLLAALADQNRPDILQIDRAVGDLVVNRRANRGSRHGRGNACRRHGHRAAVGWVGAARKRHRQERCDNDRARRPESVTHHRPTFPKVILV